MQIRCEIDEGGQTWEVVTSHDISDDKSPGDKIATIRAIISGLASAGLNAPAKVSAKLDAGPVRIDGVANGTGSSTGASFTWPPPHCGVHGSELSVSKVQKKDDVVQYYCSRRSGEDYCKSRATVEKSSSFVNFWEVK